MDLSMNLNAPARKLDLKTPGALKKVKELKELNEKEPRMTNGAENQSRVLLSHRMLSAYGLLRIRLHSTCLREDLSMTMTLPSITSFVTFILPAIQNSRCFSMQMQSTAQKATQSRQEGLVKLGEDVILIDLVQK